MSDMHFREPNQVKWMGSRPGHNGVQVLENLEAAVAGHTTIYTVPVGSTLFLAYVHISSQSNSAAIRGISIYTGGGVLHRWLAGSYDLATYFLQGINEHFWPPIEVPAGYTIRAYSSGAVVYLATIHGWAE